jgi:hypothetical protein
LRIYRIFTYIDIGQKAEIPGKFAAQNHDISIIRAAGGKGARELGSAEELWSSCRGSRSK